MRKLGELSEQRKPDPSRRLENSKYTPLRSREHLEFSNDRAAAETASATRSHILKLNSLVVRVVVEVDARLGARVLTPRVVASPITKICRIRRARDMVVVRIRASAVG